MNRKELVAFLNSLEQKYPVASWRYRDVDVWPVLKIKLFFLYLNKHIEPETGNLGSHSSLIRVVSLFLKSFWLNIKLLVFPVKIKGIFFSDAISYYSKLEKSYVNRFYFPIQQYLKRYSNYEIFRSSINESYPDDYDSRKKILFIGRLAYCRQVLSRFSVKFFGNRRVEVNVERKDSVYKDIIKMMPGIFKSEVNIDNTIIALMREILIFKSIYLGLLSSETKKVFQLCYYTPQHYGLNLACRDLNIVSYEIMHGGMGDLHIAYAGWENSIPKLGYNVLPQKIWLWDQASYGLVNKWTQKTDWHSCFVGGFPWLDYLLASNKEAFPHPGKKIIIYTMQFEFIEDYIYEAIERTGDNFEWWLRFHPRKIYARASIEKELINRRITNKVDLYNANTIPLPIILENCDLHLSEFSGSIIEASLLNKRTIILSAVGASSYYQYIQDGTCVFLANKDSELLHKMIISNSQNISKLQNYHKSNYRDIFGF